jgi:hypothetical protein
MNLEPDPAPMRSGQAADDYRRQHLGTIRGITLPVQIGGQAVGPISAGFVFDASGSYHVVFLSFAGMVALGSVLVLTAVPPGSAKMTTARHAGNPRRTLG